MDIRQETPIKSFVVAAYICRLVAGQAHYLVIKRASAHLNGTWQMVSGRLEADETAWQAALREIKEETGLIPDRLYSPNLVEQFYEPQNNCIHLVPVFVGFIDREQAVVLSHEHSDYRWITIDEADQYLAFALQRRMIREIDQQFVQEPPNEFLRIEFGNY